MLTNEFFKLKTNTNLCTVKINDKNKPTPCIRREIQVNQEMFVTIIQFLTNNHAILKCLLASYSTVRMSSTYLFHSVGLIVREADAMASCSGNSMYKSATIGDTGLPIAVPNFCLYNLPLN